jgi:ribosomal protein S3
MEGAAIDEDADLWPKVNKELNDYAITDIRYIDNYVYIYTYRPGIIIGVRGKLIDTISEHLRKWAHKKNIAFKGIKIKEDLRPLIFDLQYAVEQANYVNGFDF